MALKASTIAPRPRVACASLDRLDPIADAPSTALSRVLGHEQVNPLRLEHMTVFDAGPTELIDLAEEFDIPFVSVFLAEAMEGARPITPADAPAFRRRLKASSVSVDTVEVIALQPDPSLAEPMVALAAELGASTLVALHVLGGDENQAAQELAALAELAGRHGLDVSLEPISMGLTRTVEQGRRVVEVSGAANVGLTLDLLHIVRTGTPIDTIARLDPGLIRSAQLCDGPATIDPAAAIDEAGYERHLPGSGAFPVVPFLQALPASVKLGMEVPMKSLRLGGMSPREWTRRVVEATRRQQGLAAGAAD